MTDDFYINLGTVTNPRPYHFFKVKFTVYNKTTCQYGSRVYYISSKNSYKWLQTTMRGFGYYPLPGTYFSYSWDIEEVEDSDDIVFHHITTKENWERLTYMYFLEVCGLCDWHYSLKLRLKLIIEKLKLNFHKYSKKEKYSINI